MGTNAAVEVSNHPLLLLIVDDNPADSELIIAILKRAGYAFVYDVVSEAPDYRERLRAKPYDVILCDHNLRSWTGSDALRIYHEERKTCPFMIVTAVLGDEAAVDYIKQGACDYVLKHRLERLPGALSIALRERSHREQEERLHDQILFAKRQWELTFDAIPDPVMLLDSEERIVRANRATADLLGLSFHQFLNQSCCQVIYGDSAGECSFKQVFMPGQRGGADIEIARMGKSFHVTASPLRSRSGGMEGFVLVMHDITERQRFAQRITESELQYRRLFERANEEIIILEPQEERVLDANPRACETYGFTREELIGKSLRELTKDVGAGQNELQQLLREGSRTNFETIHLNRHGQPLCFLCNASVIEYQGKTAVLAIQRNMTEWKRLEDHLRQSQKMEAVGQLAGGIAHDFNNLLMVMDGYAELIQQSSHDSEMKRRADEILNAGRRAAALTQRLLAFGRKQAIVPRITDLDVILADITKMLRRLIPENIRLAIRRTTGLWSVKIDPIQIEQVIINLVVNARDAMPGGGDLILETANLHISDDCAAAYDDIVPGEYVELSVTDTGCGMPREVQEHIFEPFFTTKEKGEGTGLGLATVYGIVKQSGGSILVSSEPGRGTTFKLYFNRTLEKAESRPSLISSAALQGTETILVIEDEDAVRDSVTEFLRGCGYTTMQARSGCEALQMTAEVTPRIDLLISDVILPGMPGPECVEAFRTRVPDLKVIYISGYAEARLLEKGLLKPGVRFLQKPFQLSELASTIRQLLAEPARNQKPVPASLSAE